MAAHLIRERNSKIVIKAKEKFKLEHEGKFFCQVPNCGFIFTDIYGERGDNFIEAHHKRPISERVGNEETEVDDFIMVCSNCHRMIHRKPWLTEDELKELIILRE
jgi:putative restriction endonuclease